MAKQLPDVVTPLHKSPERDPSRGGGPSVASALREVAMGAVPREEVRDQDATTRKVANPQEGSVTPVLPPGPAGTPVPRRYRVWHAVVAVAVLAGGIVLAAGLRKAPTTPTTKAISVPTATPSGVHAAKRDEGLELHARSQPEPARPAPQTIHLEIRVEPAEAILTLDDAIVGNQLVVEAPKDQSIHVLKASAPGFLPVMQKINYAGDVRLAIQLRRLRVPAHGPVKVPLAKPAVKSKAPRSEARPLESARPAPTPAKMDAHTPSVLPETAEPGTNLGHPSQRRASKPIDEKDPYAQ